MPAAAAVVLSVGVQASRNDARADFPYPGHFGITKMTAGRVVAGNEPLGGFAIPLRTGGVLRYGYCITFGKATPGTAARYGVAVPFSGNAANNDRATVGVMSMLIQRYGSRPGDGGADPVDIDAAEVSTTMSHTYDEVDRNGQWQYLGKAGTSVAGAERLLAAARRFAGPYTIDVAPSLPTVLPGGSYTYSATVRNAAGPVGPGVLVSLQASGATLSTSTAVTDAHGHISVTYTVAGSPSRLAITASSSVIDTMRVLREADSTRPGEMQDFVFTGTRPSTYRALTRVTVAHPTMSTQASAAQVVVGSSLTDTISVTGTGTTEGVVTATLYGPAASQAGPWTHIAGAVRLAVHGDGSYVSPPIAVSAPGLYTWAETFVPAGQRAPAARTTPGAVTETTTVTQPVLRTQASAQRALVGASLSDAIAVTGTAGQSGTLSATLYGPAPSDQGPWRTVVRSVELAVDGDGSYATPPIRVSAPGIYTWAETLTPTGQTSPIATTAPGEVSESTTVTAVVPRHPHVPRPPVSPPPVRVETGGDSAAPFAASAPQLAGAALAGLASFVVVLAVARRVRR